MTAFRLGKQPVNRRRDLKGKPATVVDKYDRGRKAASATRGRGKKNATVRRDLGDR